MDLVQRVKNICMSPNTEWPVIAAEPTPVGTLMTGYVLPLAGVSAVAGLIGGSIIGRTIPFGGTYRVSLMAGLSGAVFAVVMAVVMCFLLAFIINALAPTFGAQQNSEQALKVAVYSYTPAWVAGILNVLPFLGALAILGGLYGIYLMYLGLPKLMKNPEDKTVGYTAVVVLCAVVLGFVVALISGLFLGAGMVGAGMMGGGSSSAPAADVQFDPDSPLGRLQQMGQGLEETSRRMEEAQKSGDTAGQTAAAMDALGTIFGGGRKVEPVEIEQLKAFVPDTFAGLAKTGSSAEKNGMAGLMVSRADATYGNADQEVTFEVVDSGGASGLMGLAGWVGLQGEREDADGTERTRRVGGRLVHEKRSKTGGTNEYSLLLADRFMMTARSRSLSVEALEAAVSRLDLDRLEGMKDVGVQP